jgi:hypothetical protein
MTSIGAITVPVGAPISSVLIPRRGASSES